MEISTALSADLKNMLYVLDRPDLDVENALLTLRADIELSVPSFVGLSMTLIVQGQPVVLTSVADGDLRVVGSSLRLPMALMSAVPQGSLVLFAITPGAFVDLATDLSYALSAPDGVLALDQDLELPAQHSGITGIAELSMINRAIGLLMGRGLTTHAASAHLQRQADHARIHLFQVAAFMVSMTE